MSKYRTRHAYEIDDRGAAGERPFRATQWLRALNPARDVVRADMTMAQIDAFGFGGINAVAGMEKGMR